jgi:methionyl-tRNA formyltransferase
MRLIFAGTPTFAAVILRALICAGHHVELVLTQPDKPAGRGMKLHESAVKKEAQKHGIAVLQPASLKSPSVVERLAGQQAAAIIVAAYGLIIPKTVLELPPFGCINIHASLLPRWRGAAPVQRAVMAGDRETGISIMQMDEGLDTGAILTQKRVPIREDDTGASLHDKLANLGARLIVHALPRIEHGKLKPQPQSHEDACYAKKLSKAEAAIDWNKEAAELGRLVRALNPDPGAYGILRGERLKVWEAALLNASGAPGQVVAAGPPGIVVACGRGGLRLKTLQRPGGKPLAAEDFLRGFTIQPGERFAA